MIWGKRYTVEDLYNSQCHCAAVLGSKASVGVGFEAIGCSIGASMQIYMLYCEGKRVSWDHHIQNLR